MEVKLILGFVISLWLTLLVVRVCAYAFHDMENYNKNCPELSKAKTITGTLRRVTRFDWHHIHFGFILLGMVILLFLLKADNLWAVILLGVSLSLILDQIIPWLDLGNYFSFWMIFISVLFHLILLEIALILWTY